MTRKKKRRLKLSTAIILFISAFTILISAILGTVLTLHSVDKMKKMVSSKAIEFAVTAAALLDGDSLKGIQASDIGSEAYNAAYNTLKAFVNSNEETSGELAYVYLCRHISGDEYEFTIDPSSDPAEFGESLEKTAALESAANGVAKFDSESYTDRWGTFYSAYAPVFDSTKTEVTMIVGIDVWADWYNNTVYSNDLLKYCEDETDDYDKLEDAIKERNIDVVPSNDSIDESLDDEEPINLAGVEEVDISDFDKFNFKIYCF